mgnify:CR=1 FL=1
MRYKREYNFATKEYAKILKEKLSSFIPNAIFITLRSEYLILHPRITSTDIFQSRLMEFHACHHYLRLWNGKFQISSYSRIKAFHISMLHFIGGSYLRLTYSKNNGQTQTHTYVGLYIGCLSETSECVTGYILLLKVSGLQILIHRYRVLQKFFH